MAHRERGAYLAANLTFEDDRISWVHDGETLQVMMSWEQPIMAKMAELCVSAGDKVLECGFGMGILSDEIQARNPGHHTIVECHPEILIKARAWAADKTNVTIVEGDWLDLINAPGRFNAILMDTYVDDNLHKRFTWFCRNKGEHNCKVSWWNWSGKTTGAYMMLNWTDVTFTKVDGLNAPENDYYNRNDYYVPLKVLPRKPTTYGVLLSSNINLSQTETMHIREVYGNTKLLTCADPGNPSLEIKDVAGKSLMFKCKGVYSINDGLLVMTGTNNMVVKRDGSWINKKMNEIVVGDKLYKADNTEVEITKIEFDSSDTVYNMFKVNIDSNYFVNNILIRKGQDNA